MFCTDIDLLRWEPNIASEAAFSTQTLLIATGTLSGTTLTLSSGSFTQSQVRPGFVACLSGGIAGCFPIISIESATTCTLSVMYDGLDATPAELVSPGTAVDLGLIVRSFYPQRRIISDLLSRMAGVEPAGSEVILNADEFRRPCVLGTLHMIYSAMATVSAESRSELLVRAELYEQLYRKSLRGLVAEIDSDNDGEPNRRQPLRAVRFDRV